MINENEFQATELVTKTINLADDELKYSDDVFNIAYGVDKTFYLVLEFLSPRY